MPVSLSLLLHFSELLDAPAQRSDVVFSQQPEVDVQVVTDVTVCPLLLVGSESPHNERGDERSQNPVSYTHLTLPTIR